MATTTTTNPGKTLFVGRIPFSATNETLEELFTPIGPLKSCFVVKDKDSEQNKGFGYVAFAQKEDAEKAIKQITSLKNRKLVVKFADKKPKKPKRKKDLGLQKEDEEEEKVPEKASLVAAKKKSSLSAEDELKRQKTHAERVKRNSVVIKDLPQEKVAEVVKETKNVVSTSFPPHMAGGAVIVYKSGKDAMRAVRKLKGQSTPLNVCLLKDMQATLKQTKESRLIVRNLAFKTKTDDLEKVFSAYGTVTDCVIPLRGDGKMFGYGFVQMSNVEEAKEAIDKMNQQKLLGRPVAVDLAVPKTQYQQTVATKKIEESHASDTHSDSEDSEEDTPTTKAKPKKKPQKKRDEESEEEEESEDEEMEVDEQNGEDNEDDEEDSDEDDDEDDDDSEEDDDSESEQAQPAQKQKKSDADEGKTVFIRNLPYDCEEDELMETFSDFGEVVMAKICVDRNTGASRGMAFVKFDSVDSVEKCVEIAKPENARIKLNGRFLTVVVAVSPEASQKITQKQKDAKKEDKDGRNLWLARVGEIRPGTAGTAEWTKADELKRENARQIKKEKLKNPNMFVSMTRLLVRNLPVAVHDADLKKAYLKAAGDKGANITESRVMRDLDNLNANGKAKSRGYAFVNFTEHKHAMAALQATNNSKDFFAENKRLIVEFSIENKAKLEAKERRQQKNQSKSEIQKVGHAAYKAQMAEERKSKLKNKVMKQQQQQTINADDDEEDEEIKKLKKAGPPTHWGPKIRHKARQPPPQHKERDTSKPSRTEKKKAAVAAVAAVETEEPKKKKSRRARKRAPRFEETDEFDAMVAKYHSKFNDTPAKKTKWYNKE